MPVQRVRTRLSRVLALGAAASLATAALAATAGSAAAASVATWDKVAECESGGDWSIVSSGSPRYYGGLQFVQSTWIAYGGQQYAPYANQATKKQQILIAEKVLARQGQTAWPHCGPLAGLGADHANPYPDDPGPVIPPKPAAKELTWYLSDDAASGVSTRPVFGFGNTPMVPLAGDFDGDGTDTQAAYDPTTSTFYLANTGSAAQSTLVFGVPGNRPVLGRWDGGTSQPGVYMPGTATFHLRHADGGVTAFAFGNGGDWRPVAGDWDGDGSVTVGLYDPATSTFYLRNSSTAGPADRTVVFGNPGSIPLAGDWDHSGRTGIGVYMPDSHTFYFRHDDGTVTSVGYGVAGDTPVTGDWNGDGRATQGVVHT
ncbi:transglycosylase family protein [Kitasatospora sp. NPDC047058]|uniref:transglycosylase family protein n=1 Tax=Kitasatospora sp. NPDC047058 TaxID=3155620 RepID=UPI003407080B